MKLSMKLAALLLGACLLTTALSGCSLRKETENTVPRKITSIYTTFYPVYALAEMIVEEVPDLQLSCLTQPMDGCLRNYCLSDWDLSLLMQSADVVIAGGQGLESFEGILYTLGENGPAVASVLNNAELASVKTENEADEDSHWRDPNPHIYMTIDGAIAIAEAIAADLTILYPESGDRFSKNLGFAKNRLESLRTEMLGITGDLNGQKAIVMNEALVYAAQEYGLDVEMVYARESGEGLYDQDLEKCLELLSSCEARVILIEKQAPEGLCRALEKAGFRIAALDVLSTRRASEGSEGYFAAQTANAQVLNEVYMRENTLEATE